MMKAFFLCLVVLACCAGCSTTYTEWRGTAVFEGKGGTVRTIDGVDFWENGEPNRKFQVVGVIDDSRGSSAFIGSGEGDIAKAAKQHGADGVIIVKKERELTGMDNNGNAHFRRLTKLFAIKYLP